MAGQDNLWYACKERIFRAYHYREILQGILQIKKDKEEPGRKALFFPKHAWSADWWRNFWTCTEKACHKTPPHKIRGNRPLFRASVLRRLRVQDVSAAGRKHTRTQTRLHLRQLPQPPKKNDTMLYTLYPQICYHGACACGYAEGAFLCETAWKGVYQNCYGVRQPRSLKDGSTGTERTFYGTDTAKGNWHCFPQTVWR